MDDSSEPGSTWPHAPLLPYPPDIMDDTDYPPLERPDTLSSKPGSEGAAAHDTCRICRSEGTLDEPLFYPCKCSGSIKFVHQECLMEWLSHSHKKHCELCKTPFRFTKLYDANMPNVLPWAVFARRAVVHLTLTVLNICRGFLVGTVWLIALPWLIRWAWRWMFWFADAGWAREAFMQMTQIDRSLIPAEEPSSGGLQLNDTIKTMASFHDSVKQIWRNTSTVMQNATTQTDQTNTTIGTDFAPSWRQADASVLSSWTYISQLTSNPRLNRIILDIFEGQLVTCVVITGFILVFLIREWVVQQQPLVNLDMLNNEERERDRQQRERDRLRQHIEPREQERIRPATARGEWPILNTLLPIRERKAAFEQTLRRLKRSDPGVPRFVGWDAFVKLMDDTTQHLKIPGEVGERIFIATALGVVKQIRAAHNEISDSSQVTDSIYEKMAMYSDEEQLHWERVIDIEVRRHLSSGTHDQGPDAADLLEAALGSRRPPMPERDFSSRATQIRRSLEEAETPASGPALPATAASASDIAGQEHGDDTTNTDSPVSTSSGWQLLSMPNEEFPAGRSLKATFESDEIPITNAGPDAKINIKRSTKNKRRLVLEIKSETALEPIQRSSTNQTESAAEHTPTNTSDVNNDPFVDAATRQEDDHGVAIENPFHPEGPLPAQREPDSLRARMANAFREEFGLEREDDQENVLQPRDPPAVEVEMHTEDVRDEAPPAVQHEAPPGMFGPLTNWFWGDIEPRDPLVDPVPAPNEEILNREEPLRQVILADEPVRVHAAPQGEQRQPDQAEPDPEVVAAAQQAGLDAEAIEDAEDLEGIFELIGFQGPLIGLFQTSCFCSVLVTGTVFAAVGLPYIWGKLVLLFIGNPVSFVLKMPLQFGSMVADVIIDITLLSGSWITIVITLAAGFLLSAVEAWVPGLAKYNITDWISSIAENTAVASESRLQAFFSGAEATDRVGWNWAFLAASVHAHASLRGLEDDVGLVFSYTGNAITSLANTVSTGSVSAVGNGLYRGLSRIFDIRAGLQAGLAAIERHLQPILQAVGNLKTGALTFQSPRMPIDPSLVFWSSTDRALAVTTGYLALAAIAAVYVALDTPISKSQTGRRLEKAVRDTLKQAGGVLKVILIISIEMLVFPLYCGFLLDLAFLPLFNGASVSTRWAFAISAPYTFGFVHWFVGTCYMFHFALFVGMCRKILRKGVLWFIRDPDDPTFHPVRDVLERNVTTQLRKIAFSALVYGALVILCLGGVIWSIGHIFEGIFPILWVSTEPILEFPLDLLLYNLITPFVIRLFKPSDAVHALYSWWLRRCARMLRLSHFLFNDQRKDEEGTHSHSALVSLLVDHGTELATGNDRQISGERASEPLSQQDGRYVLTPCNDQYRPPKPGEAFLHVDDHEMYITDKDGKKNEHFAQIYVPPYFGARVTLFMVCLWMFSVFAGLCATLMPLVLGRWLLRCALPHVSQMNDIYAYSIGAYTLGGMSLLLFHGKSVIHSVHRKILAIEARAWFLSVARCTAQTLKCVYVYGFFGLGLPVLFALILQFYFILPLHTYLHSTADVATSSLSNSTTGTASDFNDTHSAFVQFSEPGETASASAFVGHTIHLLADYALGLLYFRIIIRIIMSDPASRAAEAFRRITADGWFNPNVRLTTRFFVLPTTLMALLVFFVPISIARACIGALDFMSRNGSLNIALDSAARTVLYRYSYPLAAGWAILLWGSMEITKATSRWRSRIRDEVYLVGERLHNFGEKRPPAGSKSVIRKDR